MIVLSVKLVFVSFRLIVPSVKLSFSRIVLSVVGTEQNIYFIDLNSTVSRHTYFDITKDSYKVTINVYMDLTTKL